MLRAVLAFAGLLYFGQASACVMPSEASWLSTIKPVQGDDATLTSTFGMLFHPLLQEKKMHTGIDWAAALGTPVVAAGQGLVRAAERQGYYGNTILIDHGNGWQTRYAHLARFQVAVGDCVDAGSNIGALGATGLVSGPSLHFEILQNGQAVDPFSIRRSLPSQN